MSERYAVGMVEAVVRRPLPLRTTQLRDARRAPPRRVVEVLVQGAEVVGEEARRGRESAEGVPVGRRDVRRRGQASPDGGVGGQVNAEVPRFEGEEPALVVGHEDRPV